MSKSAYARPILDDFFCPSCSKIAEAVRKMAELEKPTSLLKEVQLPNKKATKPLPDAASQPAQGKG